MKNQKFRRVLLRCAAVMLIVTVTIVVPWAHSAQVKSIRHGIHADFERVVLDVSGTSKYHVDAHSQNGKLQITIQDVQPQDSPPILTVSNKANLVLGIAQTHPGRFEISTLRPVKTNSFAISGDTYRIIVDLYPDVVETLGLEPVTKKPPSVTEMPKQVVPESDDPLTSENIEHPQNNQIPEDEDELLYNFNGMYRMKQSALRCQTIGELDSAGMFWLEYIETARKLKTNLTGNSEFALANWRDESSISNVGAIFAKIYSNLPLIPVMILGVLGILFVFFRRKLIALIKRLLKKKQEDIDKDNLPEEAPSEPEETSELDEEMEEPVEDEIVEEPPEEQIEEEPVEEEVMDESEAEKTVDKENIDIPEEQSAGEETKGDEKTPKEDDEDTALEELMESDVDEIEETIDDEPTEEDKKVQRILELAGEEKSIAEIAEEMGIGEDEVRLVLDLQGTSISDD